ncbi:hypothetical protein N9R81_05350, partial [Flavobacteriales bacterium]|nr:hypothetical protein [Flavobacteriales bacterium]
LYSLINTAGTYTIAMTEFTDFPVGYSVVLTDLKLGVSESLNDGAYTFVGSPSDLSNRFNITASLAVLPVDLLGFKAYEETGRVYLEWTTITEMNCDYYRVERSREMEVWKEVARVAGMGTSDQLTSYREFDDSPILNQSYYRLAQVDFDGKINYSQVVTVDIFKGNTVAEVYNYQNGFELAFRQPLKEECQVYLYNVLGQIVFSFSLQKGDDRYLLPEGVLNTPGEYFLVSEGAGFSFKIASL